MTRFALRAGKTLIPENPGEPPAGELDRFRDMYEGGQVIQRIRGFISAPRDINIFYDPSDPNPLLGKWQNPFEITCQPALVNIQPIHA